MKFLDKPKTFMADSPFDADYEFVKLKANDIVIAATDGLFDNVYEHEIIKIVEGLEGKTKENASLAKRICK